MSHYAPIQRLSSARRDDLPDNQKAIWDHVVETRGLSFMPNMFSVMAHSPRALKTVASVGEHVRWHSALDDDLREMVICTVSLAVGNVYEWNHHIHKVPQKYRESVGTLEIENEKSAISVALRFCRLLASGQEIKDELVAQLRVEFGSDGFIDLVIMVGYYQLLGSFCAALGIETEESVERSPFNE